MQQSCVERIAELREEHQREKSNDKMILERLTKKHDKLRNERDDLQVQLL